MSAAAGQTRWSPHTSKGRHVPRPQKAPRRRLHIYTIPNGDERPAWITHCTCGRWVSSPDWAEASRFATMDDPAYLFWHREARLTCPGWVQRKVGF